MRSLPVDRGAHLAVETQIVVAKDVETGCVGLLARYMAMSARVSRVPGPGRGQGGSTPMLAEPCRRLFSITKSVWCRFAAAAAPELAPSGGTFP